MNYKYNRDHCSTLDHLPLSWVLEKGRGGAGLSGAERSRAGLVRLCHKKQKDCFRVCLGGAGRGTQTGTWSSREGLKGTMFGRDKTWWRVEGEQNLVEGQGGTELGGGSRGNRTWFDELIV